jgi:glycosyltransferase involved in cell wall biosynthesis|tara:strand:+ start:2594 stop:3244 length:651 start_codon:yes stop_codon:yes gene_type:complete
MNVSIIIINNNREKFIERCLRSCIDQILFNKTFEVIFVDDGSSDSSWEILKKFKSDVKSFRLKKNMGISYASNYAIGKAKGEYIMRVDSDDYINKHTINFMSLVLDNNPEIAFVCSDHYRVNDSEFIEERVALNDEEVIKNHGAGILFRKTIIEEFNGYNTNLKEAEDYELIRKIIKKYPYFYLPIPLYRYYIHDLNISHSGNRESIIRKINKEKK